MSEAKKVTFYADAKAIERSEALLAFIQSQYGTNKYLPPLAVEGAGVLNYLIRQMKRVK